MFNQDYLTSLITNKVEEDLHLDYKASGALKQDDKTANEISKDVAAFANSDGGMLIYGLKEDPSNKHLVYGIESIDRKVISKEWLDQIINSRIRPKIMNVLIHPIEIDNNSDEVVYIVEIPKSTTAHQSGDKKYYKRYNFASEAMYDYEIRDILNRSERTQLRIEKPSISQRAGSIMGGKPNEYFATISINILNTGQAIEKLYKVEVRIPRLIAIISQTVTNTSYYKHLIRHEETHSLFSIPNESPIFQDELATIRLAEFTINKSNLSDLEQNDVFVKLYYSNGVVEMSFNLLDYLNYNGQKLFEGTFRV